MTKARKITIAYMDDPYEAEGVFDEKGVLLDCWSCNDANWRGEYMNGFMKKLGIAVKTMGANEKQKAAIMGVFGE
jgi:hypothetical protein